MANVRLFFANGSVANLNVSRVSEHPVRKMCIFQPENYIMVNFQEKKVEKVEFQNRNTLIAEISVIEHNAIVEELSDFLQTIHHNSVPKVSMYDGLNALRIADKIVKKIMQQNEYL